MLLPGSEELPGIAEEIMKIELSKPYNFDGVEFTAVDMDLDALTGRDVSAAKKDWARQGNFAAVTAVDLDFCAYLAAKACKQPVEFVEGLPARDYCKLAQEVSNFLLG